MENELVIVGTGSGELDQIIPEGLKAIRKAEILIGSKRLLRLACEDQVTYEIDSDLQALKVNLVAWRDRGVVVLVSGDPGFYSILDWIKREFPDRPLKVIPGISSMQLAFARAGRSWFDYKFISLHGRTNQGLVVEVRKNSKICIITDSNSAPHDLLETLKGAEVGPKWIFIGSQLGTSREVVWEGSLADLSSAPNDPYSVVIIEDETVAL